MKIVLWIGNEPNQIALANKIHQVFPLSGIVTESRVSQQKLSTKIIAEKIIEKFLYPQLGKAWVNMLQHYNKQFPALPNVPTCDVENINSEKAYNFTKELQPDLILVSGTRLVKKHMFEIPVSKGVLNLHTGLSPYVKGGPNCTNICLADKQFHLIGNTIMWIDEGIDSGNILTTDFTPLTGNESLDELHILVMEHAHTLYCEAVRYLNAGKHQSIVQNLITSGKTHYNKDWTLKRKIQAIKNHRSLKKYVQSKQIEQDRASINVVQLN